MAVPSPTRIPPYIHARSLSSVSGLNFSKISINTDRDIVPIIPYIAVSFPTLIIVKINNGIFKISIVVPSGNLKR